MKRILCISGFALLSSCDTSHPLEVNSNAVYNVNTNCGEIEFSAHHFDMVFFIDQKFHGGNFVIRPNELKIVTSPADTLKIGEIVFSGKNGKLISQDSFVVKEGLIKVSFRTSVSFTVKGEANILILPSNYITCGNKPLITDTIRIRHKRIEN